MQRHVERKCSLWWCNGVHYAHGLCERHYETLRRTGSAVSPKSRDTRKLVTRCEELSVLLAVLAGNYIEDGWCSLCHEYEVHDEKCSVGQALDLARDTLQSWEPEREIA